MAYDEKLAEGVRNALSGLPKIEENKIMGGLRKQSRLNESRNETEEKVDVELYIAKTLQYL